MGLKALSRGQAKVARLFPTRPRTRQEKARGPDARDSFDLERRFAQVAERAGAKARASHGVPAKRKNLASVRTDNVRTKDASSLSKIRAELGEAFARPGEPVELLTVVETVMKRGFRLVVAEDGVAHYRRGDVELRLRPFELGTHLAIDLELERAGKKKSKTKEGVLFNGVLLEKKYWTQLADRFQREIDDFLRATEKNGADDAPGTLDELKRFVADGRSKKKRAKEAEQAQEIANALAGLTEHVEALKREGRAPKGIIVYAAGPDGAGKSSTGQIVMKALEDAGYAPGVEIFKAPTAEERAQHWLSRFERGVPKAGQAIFWDRGPAGDTVYAPRTHAEVKKMARELDAFEGRLADEGVLFFKLELYADKEKQAATFGKRLARQFLADRIEKAMDAKGELDVAARAELEAIKGKIDPADFKAFAAYDEVQAKFLRFTALTRKHSDWVALDATKRHGARLELVERMSASFDAFAEKHGRRAA